MKINNISIEPEVHARLKAVAAKKEVTLSKVLNELASRYLFDKEDEIPVILKIPAKLKGNSESLREWLNIKVDAITKALS